MAAVRSPYYDVTALVMSALSRLRVRFLPRVFYSASRLSQDLAPCPPPRLHRRHRICSAWKAEGAGTGSTRGCRSCRTMSATAQSLQFGDVRALVQACEILQLGQQSTTRSNPLEDLDLSKMSDEELVSLYQTMAKQP